MNVENTLNVYDELGVTATNKDGDIVAERIQKTDLNTEASLTADAGSPSRMSVGRNERVDGFQEEGEAANALVQFYNS